MIVAQLAIPLAGAVALLFATWFALDILLRTLPSEAVAEAAERTRERASSFVWRFVTLSMTAALAAGAGLGAAVGAYRDGVESGAVAGLSVVVGALAAAVTVGVGVALGQRASERAATAADRTLRQALAVTLWSGAAPALLGGALAVAGVAGLYGIATRFADVPGGEAGFLVLGAGAGAALTALTSRLLAASDSTASDGDEEERSEAGAAAAGGADTLALMAAGCGAGLVLGAPLAQFTDELVWVLAPLVVMALGLGAATLASITLPFWARALRNAGRSVVAGYWVAAPLAALLAFAMPLVLLDEGRWWFAGAGLTGAGMSVLVFVAGQRIVGDGSGYRGTGAAFALLAGATLVAAFVLGRQVEIEGVGTTVTAFYGVAMAAAGALALAPSTIAVRWFGAGAATAVALAEGAREATPPDEEGPAPLPLAPLAATSGRANAPAWCHPIGWTVLVGAVAVAALLLAVRGELGRVAANDAPRFVNLAADLGVVPDSEALQAQAAFDVAAYLDQLDRQDVTGPDLAQLMLADEEEARRLLTLRNGDEGLGADERAIAGSPWPFPALPPLRIDGLVGLGVLAGLVALLGGVGLTAAGGRWMAGRTLGAMVVAAGVPLGAALAARAVSGGNGGWEVAAGAALGGLVAGLALAARDGGGEGVAGKAGLALAVWLGAAGAVIMPALVAA